MIRLVDGKKIAGEILKELQARIQTLGFKPRLVVIMVGENPASLSYIKMKQKRGEEIGISVEINRYKADIAQEKLVEEIQRFNKEENVRGILIQLPLPKHVDRDAILNAVAPALDVDCLTEVNKKRLIAGQPLFIPPAAAAAMKILEYYSILSPPARGGDEEGVGGRNVLIVGSGELIGKPLSAMFLNKKIPFELANRHTENLKELASRADIIITGVGQAGLITGNIIKKGAVVIDAGTTGSDEGTVVGDVDFDSVSKKASLLSPVPGGVGPVTVAMLLRNVLDFALHKNKEDL